MSVAVEPAGQTFKWGTMTMLFPAPYSAFVSNTGPRNYDVSPNSPRFLVVKDVPPDADTPQLVVIEHWFEELRAKAPTK